MKTKILSRIYDLSITHTSPASVNDLAQAEDWQNNPTTKKAAKKAHLEQLAIDLPSCGSNHPDYCKSPSLCMSCKAKTEIEGIDEGYAKAKKIKEKKGLKATDDVRYANRQSEMYIKRVEKRGI